MIHANHLDLFSKKCSRLQLISCYSFRMFQLHSQQKLRWVITYMGDWPPEGMKDTTIRHYTKHTIIVCVPTNPNKSHITLCRTPHSLWSSPLPEPPTCGNHSVLLCVGARRSACWDPFHASQCVAGARQADCYIRMPPCPSRGMSTCEYWAPGHGLCLGKNRSGKNTSFSAVLRHRW